MTVQLPYYPVGILMLLRVLIGAHEKATTNILLNHIWFIERKYPDDDINVILCIDTDVFEFVKKPPVDKTAVKKSIEEAGAKKVCYIEARHSIEDWFLEDFEGVVSYLRLPRGTVRPKGKGQEV